jgi:hypothetical protein
MNYAFLSQYYFTDWIMFCITIIAFGISLRSFHDKRLKILTVYLSGTIIMDALAVFFDAQGLNVGSNEYKYDISLNIYMLFECTTFTFYIFTNLAKSIWKVYTIILYCIFIIFLLIIWNKYPTSFSKYSPQLFAIEGLFIVLFCLFYLYELSKSSLNLKKQPSFWIITGSIFYFSVTIPYYLLFYSLQNRLPEYLPLVNSLSFILYSILYLFFIKAFLCPQQIPA